jgi:hypothetical protein
MDFETYMKKYRPEIRIGTKEYYDLQCTWDAANRIIVPEMTDEDFDLAVGSVTSFYQSKRAKLKKQVTHWIGKFMIVKNENNVTRQKNKHLCRMIKSYRDSEIQLQREVKALKAIGQSNVAKLASTIRSHENTITVLESQVKELEAGMLV